MIIARRSVRVKGQPQLGLACATMARTGSIMPLQCGIWPLVEFPLLRLLLASSHLPYLRAQQSPVLGGDHGLQKTDTDS